MIIRPVDLPLVREELARLTSSAVGDWAFGELAKRFVFKDRDLGDAVAKEEADRLRRAELFFASGDMSALAIAASEGLPAFNLLPEDLPSACGFLFLEEPVNIGELSEDGRQQAPIVAVSWGPMHVSGELVTDPSMMPHGALWVSWYLGREEALANAGLHVTPGKNGADLDRWIATFRHAPRLMCIEVSVVPFSPEAITADIGSDGDRPVRLDDSEGAGRWMRILKSAWLLMQQPVATVSDAEYKRHDRRRLERQKIEPSRVRVIMLRRAKTTSEHGDSDREFHHQWIVRGHWRQQWYPSRGVHRPVWIAPHIKGPEGAPMLGGEKVHAWVR
ncbi:hypothetical protein FH608_046500 [Nonomuraea phyllanthi]|uniref:Uncharacterized protein n=1 Tax=Nonomuraea phyllanthi TaxID=2219224 RepID=A0A5C4V6X2_9ACTN|nr:hypothetical protein [Nonomuraea phyllanthi]KAB8186944.1 hypothetical protein FH608_046500 [Nonomuraea phyllanthi]